MTDIPGLPYDGVTDVVDLSGNGKGVALEVWPRLYRVPLVEDPEPADSIILTMGEVIYAMTSQRLRVGDGYTPGGDEIAYTSDMDAIEAAHDAQINAMMTELSSKANVDESNVFIGDQTFTGNVIVNGSLSVSNLTVPDEVYSVAWNGKTQVPTKNAVFDKIELLVTDIAGKAALSHTHLITDVIGLQGVLDAKAPLIHTHVIGDVTGLQTALDGKQPVGSYATTSIFTSVAPGIVPASGGVVTNFLCADGVWRVPATGVGSVAWGAITGTLSSQTDLNTALGLKYDKTGGTITGNVTISGSSAALTLNPTSGSSIIDVRGTGGTNDGLRISGAGATSFLSTDTLTIRNRATTVPYGVFSSTGLAMSLPVTVPDDPYAVGWNGSAAAPTKNAVYDKIEAVVGSIPAAPSSVISDVAYAPSWDGVTGIAPTKNAVYDKIEALAATIPPDSTAAVALKVAKAGDTMSGALTFNGGTDAARSIIWSGGAQMWANAGGAWASKATDHNWTNLAGAPFGSLQSAGLFLSANMTCNGNAWVGPSSGAAADTSITMQNTGSYNTLSMNSYNTGGTGLSGDAYIQSLRAGALAISGITGIDFRVLHTKYAQLTTLGLVAYCPVQAKALVPGSNGWAGLAPGSTANAGYVEFYNPAQARVGYIGFADATSFSYTVEAGLNSKHYATSHLFYNSANGNLFGAFGPNGASSQLAVGTPGQEIFLLADAAQQKIFFASTGGTGFLYGDSIRWGFYKAGGGHMEFEHAFGNLKVNGKQCFRQANSAFLSSEIYIGSGAPSGGSDGDVWLQFV